MVPDPIGTAAGEGYPISAIDKTRPLFLRYMPHRRHKIPARRSLFLLPAMPDVQKVPEL
jgi:hypothetical protein